MKDFRNQVDKILKRREEAYRRDERHELRPYQGVHLQGHAHDWAISECAMSFHRALSCFHLFARQWAPLCCVDVVECAVDPEQEERVVELRPRHEWMEALMHAHLRFVRLEWRHSVGLNLPSFGARGFYFFNEPNTVDRFRRDCDQILEDFGWQLSDALLPQEV